jgi:hypothetical protein
MSICGLPSSSTADIVLDDQWDMVVVVFDGASISPFIYVSSKTLHASSTSPMFKEMIEQFRQDGELLLINGNPSAVITVLQVLHGRNVEVPCWIEPAVLNELAGFSKAYGFTKSLKPWAISQFNLRKRIISDGWTGGGIDQLLQAAERLDCSQKLWEEQAAMVQDLSSSSFITEETYLGCVDARMGWINISKMFGGQGK